MSEDYNGSIIESTERTDILENPEISVDIRGNPFEPFGGVSSPEVVFQGFQKAPVVVLPRMDITPFIKNNKNTVNSGSEIDKQTNSKEKKENIDFSAFSKKCSVKVVRHDLNKLLQSFSTNHITDDTTMKCKICDKEYSSEKKLINHQEKKHMIVYQPKKDKVEKHVSFSDHVIVHELNEYHRCRKCTKIFEDYKSLKIHMKEQHKKRKCYICYYCSKDFVDRTFFKVHIKLHCDVCGRLTINRSQLVEHKKTVCKVLKPYNCKTCNANFFNFMDLKDHSYDHLGTYFICDICKDQFQTKCEMSHHISFLHLQKQPKAFYEMRNMGTERLYLCNFCDESSVEREMIEKHISTLPDLSNRVMTGYTDYYFCDQCLKKFDTEKDMLHHKWSHYLTTSEDSQPEEGTVTKKPIIPLKFNVNNKIPDYLLPNIVLKKIKVGGKVLDQQINGINVKNFDIHNGEIKKPVVDSKSRKTLLSKHQCQTCDRYFSSGYCLNRHIATQHSDYDSLTCKVCEETFVWPSLLQSHKCIRLNIPEMPFEDARPEIHFEYFNDMTQEIDDFNIEDNDDYMNSVDFEIPAPIVELTEQDGFILTTDNVLGNDTMTSNSNLPKSNILSNILSNNIPQCNAMADNFLQNNIITNNVDYNVINPNIDVLQTENCPIIGNMFPNNNVLMPGNNLFNGNVLSVHNSVDNSEIPVQNGYKLVMQEVPIEF